MPFQVFTVEETFCHLVIHFCQNMLSQLSSIRSIQFSINRYRLHQGQDEEDEDDNADAEVGSFF